MISEQDLQVIAKYVIDAFQRGKFKAILPPIRAEVNHLKSVGTGFSLVDGKEGEALTLLGLIPGPLVDIKKVGRDLQISIRGMPDVLPVYFNNLKGVSVSNAKEGDLLCMKGGRWVPVEISEIAEIQELKTKKSYPDEDRMKLSGIEDGAQKNPSAEQVKYLYESNDNTNAFTNEYRAAVEDAQVRSHHHANKDILDQYTVPNESIKKSVENSHLHPNIDILASIKSAGSGKIITEEERQIISKLSAILPDILALLDKGK